MIESCIPAFSEERLETSSSTLCSDASSCLSCSPPTSFVGLRRSTIDLSELKSRTRTATPSRVCKGSCCPPSLTSRSNKARELESNQTIFLKPSTMGYSKETPILYLIADVVFSLECSIRKFIDEANKHVAEMFSVLIFAVFAGKFVEPLEGKSSRTEAQCAVLGTISGEFQVIHESDVLLSPLRTTPTPSANLKDGWGHFADFQDELADESSFIPSCSTKAMPQLGTLNESEEYIEEDDDCDFF